MNHTEASQTFVIVDDNEQEYGPMFRAFGGRWTYDALHAETFDRPDAEDFNRRYYDGRYRVVSVAEAIRMMGDK